MDTIISVECVVILAMKRVDVFALFIVIISNVFIHIGDSNVMHSGIDFPRNVH